MNPYLSLSLAVTLFSFVGIPPLIGFFAKQMVLSSALDNGYIFIVLIAILSSVVSAYYYLVLVKQIFFEKSDYMLNPALKTTTLKVKFKKTNINPFARDETSASQDKDVIINTDNIQLSSFLTISVSILTLIILLFILIPQE
jgi:NADH-ubiquinone oxidoreductase chain 2